MICKWAKEELSGINLGDERLDRRTLQLLSAASRQPQSSINKMFHTRKEVQACYRFFSNDLVDETKIFAPHREKTVERIKKHPIVLCISDTTSLNYTTRKTLKDSGYISSNNAQGFFLHATIAVTPDRLHLGIVAQKFWARQKEKPVTRIHQDNLPLAEKESYRWLEGYVASCVVAESSKDAQIIHITDREGDLFEIYAEYQSRKAAGIAADYIVRSNHNRTVYPEDKSPNTLYSELEESKILGEIGFDIINRKDNKPRHVRQSVQALPVKIKSRYGSDKPNVKAELNVIYLAEINPPTGEKPVNWCLLTSLPIDSQEGIMSIVQYYLCRWEIEVFFKTYKSGCKVEEKSLRSAERLYPLFSLLLIVAWRVNFLVHMSRLRPEISCEVFFEASEWKAGYIAATRNREHPPNPPTMREMIGYVARLGGHLGRKSDTAPGCKAIWVGVCKLANYADAWDLFGPGAAAK
jgi:hypothetical protein